MIKVVFRALCCGLLIAGIWYPSVAVSGVQTISLSGIPTAVTYAQDGNRVYISVSNAVSQFDPGTLTQPNGPVPLGGDVAGFNIDPVWKTLFAPTRGGAAPGVVNLVDMGSSTVPVVIPLQSVPGVVAIDSKTQHLYVALPSENKLKVVDMSKAPFAFEPDVKLSNAPTALWVDEAGGGVVIGMANGTLVELVTANGSLFGSLSIGGTIHQIVASTSTDPKLKGQLYITTDSQLVTLSGTNPFTIAAQTPIQGSPWAIAMNQATGNLFVTQRDKDSVAVINAFTHNIFATVPVVHKPTGIAVVTSNGTVTPGEHTVFVTGDVDSAASVFSDPSIGKDLITVPVRWCALAGSIAANGTTVPSGQNFTAGNSTTDSVLLKLLRTATSQVWIDQSNSHIAFRAAAADHFPVVANPDPTIQDGSVTLGIFNADLTSGWDSCEQAWAAMYPGQRGTIALNVQNFNSSTAGVTPRPDNLIQGQPKSAALCVAPRTLGYDDVSPQLFIATADPTEYSGIVPLPNGGNRISYLTSSDSDASAVVVAHELGHSLLLGHGDGLDNNHDGLLPPTPGPRKYDSFCDPLGVDANDSPKEDLLGDQPSGCSSLMVWEGICRALRPLQVETARDVAPLVPGSVTTNGMDPWGTVVAIQPNALKRRDAKSEVAFASLTLSQTPSRGTTEIAARLSGRMREGQRYQYIFFLDEDGNSATGCEYRPVGRKEAFRGGEMLVSVTVQGLEGGRANVTDTTLEYCREGQFIPLTGRGVTSSAYNVSLEGEPVAWAQVATKIPNSLFWRSLRTARIAATVRINGSRSASTLPVSGIEGALISLRPPELPTCAVSSAAVSVGEQVIIDGNQVPSMQAVDVFVGNELVGTTTSNALGRASFGWMVDTNQSPGLKQVSLVAHATAHTATCVLYVSGAPRVVRAPWLWIAAGIAGRPAPARKGEMVTIATEARIDSSASVKRAPLELHFDPHVLSLVRSSMTPARVENGKLLWDLGVGTRTAKVSAAFSIDVTFRVIGCERSSGTVVSVSSPNAVDDKDESLPRIETTSVVRLDCHS
jgi:hypothetical protein